MLKAVVDAHFQRGELRFSYSTESGLTENAVLEGRTQIPSLVAEPRRSVYQWRKPPKHEGASRPQIRTRVGGRLPNDIDLIDRISFGVELLGPTNPDGHKDNFQLP